MSSALSSVAFSVNQSCYSALYSFGMQMNWHGSAMESVSDDDEASDEIKFDGTAKQSFRQRCRVDAGASVAQ